MRWATKAAWLLGVLQLDDGGEGRAVRAGRARDPCRKWRPLVFGAERAVGEAEDLGRGAVVGLDAVDDRALVPVGERHDVLEVGAAPRVDALGVVAHGHDAVVRGEPVHDLGLDGVGVLVFVDEDVAEAVVEILGDVRGLGEELQPELEEVVVVGDLVLALLLLVGGGEGREAVADLAVLREVALDGLVDRRAACCGRGRGR